MCIDKQLAWGKTPRDVIRSIRQVPRGSRGWPTVDPESAGSDLWFGEGRLVRRPAEAASPARRDELVLERAWSMSRRAVALSHGEGPSPREARSLRVQAAEWKRAAGAPAEAFEDYEALARHYRSREALKPTIAYMRKALHVSDLGGDDRTRFAARMLAAEVYLAAQQPAKVLAMTREATRFARAAGIRDGEIRTRGLAEAAWVMPELSPKRCACGRAAGYARCCGMADVTPVEYSQEAAGLVDAGTPSPFRPSDGLAALETLMRPPPGAERTTWYAWHVEDGCHRLVAYSNWSGRAIRAAERMARIARDEDCPDAASSAVLQSYVALEAFLSSWRMLGRLDAVRRRRPKRRAVVDEAGAPMEAPFVNAWHETAAATFGSEWSVPDEVGFIRLALLRNALCHSVSVPVTVIPRVEVTDRSVDYFRTLGHAVGEAPAPLADRVLTPAVANWAVEVAKEQIAAVRKTWNAAALVDELDEWMLGADQDAEHAAAEGRWGDRGGTWPMPETRTDFPDPAARGFRFVAEDGSVTIASFDDPPEQP